MSLKPKSKTESFISRYGVEALWAQCVCGHRQMDHHLGRGICDRLVDGDYCVCAKFVEATPTKTDWPVQASKSGTR
jgi:hypothetical protein